MEPSVDRHNLRTFGCRQNAGFSLVELLIAMSILIIMTAVAVPVFYNYRVVYQSEEQAIKIMDLAREASQLALNRRRTYRMELDVDANAVLIIDENSGGQATLVKSIPLESSGVLKVDEGADGITAPDPPGYPDAIFADDTIGHFVGETEVTGHKVWALRFKSDGSVMNASGTPISAFLWVYPPSGSDNTPSDANQVRGVSIYGGSGVVRLWRYDGTKFSAR